MRSRSVTRASSPPIPPSRGRDVVKIPDPRFKRYRLRLREEGGSLLGPSQWKENDLVWGKPVGLYEFTEYEAEELATRSPFWLSVFRKLWGNDSRLEIWGELASDGTWVPISPWLLKERRAREHLRPRIQERGNSPDQASVDQMHQRKLEDEANAACVEGAM